MTSIEDKIEHPISEDDDEDDEIDDWMKSVENKIAILEKNNNSPSTSLPLSTIRIESLTSKFSIRLSTD